MKDTNPGKSSWSSNTNISTLKRYNQVACVIHAINTLSQLYLGSIRPSWTFRVQQEQYRDYAHVLCISFADQYGIGRDLVAKNPELLSIEYCDQKRKAILKADKCLTGIKVYAYNSCKSKHEEYVPAHNGQVILSPNQVMKMMVGLYGFSYQTIEDASSSTGTSTWTRFHCQQDIIDEAIDVKQFKQFEKKYNISITRDCDQIVLESCTDLVLQSIKTSKKEFSHTCGKIFLDLDDFVSLFRGDPTFSFDNSISIKIDSKVLARPVRTVETNARQFLRPFKQTVKRVSLAMTVAGFSAICFGSHATLLFLGSYFPYSSKLNYYNMIFEQRINYVRWIEYSLSSGLMLVNIAALSQIMDRSALLNILMHTGMTNYFGLWTELAPSKFKIYPFVLGFIPFFVPWMQIFGKTSYTSNFFAREIKPLIEYRNNGQEFAVDIPLIFKITTTTLFGIYFLFPANMYVQYWIYGKDEYYKGERNYLLLSAISKSFLSWMIFAGTLQEDADYLGSDDSEESCACRDL